VSRIVLALSLLPAVAVAWFVAGIEPVPFLDGWKHLEQHTALQEGRLGLAGFLAPDRMHWVVVPRTVRTLLALATDWSLRAEIWTCFALALATAWGLRRVSPEPAPSHRSRLHREIANALCVLLLFSPALLPAWSWPPAIVHFAMNAFLVLAAGELQRVGAAGSRGPLLRAGLLCAAASLTRAEGFLSWLLLLPILWDRIGGERSARRPLAAWVLAGGVFAGATAWATAMSPVDSAPPELARTGLLLLDVLGLPFGRGLAGAFPAPDESELYVPVGALVIGALALLAGALLRAADADLRRRALPWLALAAFGGSVSLGVALTRQQMMTAGYAHAFFLPMYALASLLASIALVQLAGLYLAQRPGSPPWRGLRVLALGLALASAAATYAIQGPEAVELRRHLRGADVCLPLAAHWAAPNACFGRGPRPAQLELLRRSGFIEVVEELPRVADPDLARGRIESARWAEDGDLLVAGRLRLAGADPAPGHVLFSYGPGDGFVAFAPIEDREGGKARFEARLPGGLFAGEGPRLRAWAYLPEPPRVVALSRGVRLPARSAAP